MRLSVGLEDADDICEDLEQALGGGGDFRSAKMARRPSRLSLGPDLRVTAKSKDSLQIHQVRRPEGARSANRRVKTAPNERLMLARRVSRFTDGDYYVGSTSYDDKGPKIAFWRRTKTWPPCAKSLTCAASRHARLGRAVRRSARCECERHIKGWRREKKEALIGRNWSALKLLAERPSARRLRSSLRSRLRVTRNSGLKQTLKSSSGGAARNEPRGSGLSNRWRGNHIETAFSCTSRQRSSVCRQRLRAARLSPSPSPSPQP